MKQNSAKLSAMPAFRGSPRLREDAPVKNQGAVKAQGKGTSMPRPEEPDAHIVRRKAGRPGRELEGRAMHRPDFDSVNRDLVALLKFIEHSHRQNRISDGTYYEIKGEALKKLAHAKKFGRLHGYGFPQNATLAGETESGTEEYGGRQDEAETAGCSPSGGKPWIEGYHDDESAYGKQCEPDPLAPATTIEDSPMREARNIISRLRLDAPPLTPAERAAMNADDKDTPQTSTSTDAVPATTISDDLMGRLEEAITRAAESTAAATTRQQAQHRLPPTARQTTPGFARHADTEAGPTATAGGPTGKLEIELEKLKTRVDTLEAGRKVAAKTGRAESTPGKAARPTHASKVTSVISGVMSRISTAISKAGPTAAKKDKSQTPQVQPVVEGIPEEEPTATRMPPSVEKAAAKPARAQASQPLFSEPDVDLDSIPHPEMDARTSRLKNSGVDDIISGIMAELTPTERKAREAAARKAEKPKAKRAAGTPSTPAKATTLEAAPAEESDSKKETRNQQEEVGANALLERLRLDIRKLKSSAANVKGRA